MGGPRGVIRPGVNFTIPSKEKQLPKTSDEHRQQPSEVGGRAKKVKRKVGGGGAGGDGEADPADVETLVERRSGVPPEGKTKKDKSKRNASAEGDVDEKDDKETSTRGAEVGGTEGDGDRGGGVDDDSFTNNGKAKKKKNKKLRQQQLMAHLSLRAEATTPVVSRDHPFEVDAADHCETPFQAYQDIEPFLFRIALALKKPKDKLRIYDPYFCEGSVAKHLTRLGFTNVYNANEDFYKCIEEKRIPDHDVLLTNPPYSGDHFRRILSFCGKSKKPWLLLLPNFVCRKQYYQPAIGGEGVKPLFLIPDPLKPYRYWAPGRKGFEERNQAKGTTPFETFWYVDMAGLVSHDEVRAWWLKKFAPHSRCTLPALDEALPQQQRLQKRGNPRARKIAAQRERETGRSGIHGASKGGGIYYDLEKAKKVRVEASKFGDQHHRGGGGGRGDRGGSRGDGGSGGKRRSGDTRGRGGDRGGGGGDGGSRNKKQKR